MTSKIDFAVDNIDLLIAKNKENTVELSKKGDKKDLTKCIEELKTLQNKRKEAATLLRKQYKVQIDNKSAVEVADL